MAVFKTVSPLELAIKKNSNIVKYLIENGASTYYEDSPNCLVKLNHEIKRSVESINTEFLHSNFKINLGKFDIKKGITLIHTIDETGITLDFSSNQLTDEELRIICIMLTGHNVYKQTIAISLFNNNIGSEGVESLVKIISNFSIKSLNLCKNQIFSTKSMWKESLSMQIKLRILSSILLEKIF